MAMQTRIFDTVTRGASGGADASITISTRSIDRDGDILEPEGAVMDAYRRNPVVMFAHGRPGLASDTAALPIGTTTRFEIKPGAGIVAEWRWLKGDPLADRVRNAFDQGVLRGASVGFIPIASEPMPDGIGRRYTKWEVTEWSLVPIPSNREAVKMLKAAGLYCEDFDPIVFRLKDDADCAIRIRDDSRDTVTIDEAMLRRELPALLAGAIDRAFREQTRGLHPAPGSSWAERRDTLRFDPNELASAMRATLPATMARIDQATRAVAERAADKMIRALRGQID